MNASKFPEQLGRRGLRTVARHSLAVLLASTALGVVSARAQDATWVGNNAGEINGISVHYSLAHARPYVVTLDAHGSPSVNFESAS